MDTFKDQVVHDLAMSCVNGIVQNKVLRNVKESDDDYTSVYDFTDDVVAAYKAAWDEIYPLIDVSEDD